MHPHAAAMSVSDVVVENLKKVRKRRDLSSRDLGARCAKRGARHLTAAVIANIESGRPGPDGKRTRNVTVDELLALAYVLDVAPTHLLLPLRDGDGTTPMAVTDLKAVDDRSDALAWIRGERPLPHTDDVAYLAAALENAPAADAERTLAAYAREVIIEQARDLIAERQQTRAEIAQQARNYALGMLQDVEDLMAHGTSADEVRRIAREFREALEQTPLGQHAPADDEYPLKKGDSGG